ncbi:MAG TPA: hypothetical protein VG222_19015 [Vicinamibacterales bacterium]|jgi:hypothetical protein|nr:hypothetical protein [Vicinamibacterales bacterium]
MLHRAGDRARRSLRFIGVALYAVFLVTAPFEHHDLNCELKTPQHCTSCTSSQLGADPYTPAVCGDCHLADAGRAVAFVVVSDGVLLQVKTTGRSPPAHA